MIEQTVEQTVEQAAKQLGEPVVEQSWFVPSKHSWERRAGEE
jgi:hypothetical protein